MKALYPLTEIFFNTLRNNDIKYKMAPIYKSLFSILSKESLENQLHYLYDLSEGRDSYFKDDGKENWFYIFHKSIRQCDFFNDCFKKSKFESVTGDEENEFRFLYDKVKTEGYVKEGENSLFNDEYRRYLELHEKRRRQLKEESINGYLDSILWDMIHADDDNSLKIILEKTFHAYASIFEDGLKKV